MFLFCSFISDSSTGQNGEDTISDEEGSVFDSNTYSGAAASELGANVSSFDCDGDDSDNNGGDGSGSSDGGDGGGDSDRSCGGGDDDDDDDDDGGGDDGGGDDHVEDSRASSTSHFNSQENPSTGTVKEEIVSRILKGLILAEEMKTSVRSMEYLLEYAKDHYCKGDHNLEKYWPSNWRETEKLLKEVGYEDPKQYFICLDGSHHANYDIMEDKNSLCRFCGKPGTIQYYYLGLPQKVKLWCSDESVSKGGQILGGERPLATP